MKKLFYISLFLPLVVWAQAPYVEGYIITNNGDTIRGKIKDRKFTKDPPQCNKISFIDAAENQTYKTPDDIKQYYKKGKHYYTLNVGFENKPKFCEVVFDGEVILFGFENDTQSFIANDMGAKTKERVEDKNQTSYVEYFLQRKGKPNSLMKVKRKHFEETVTFFFEDNAELVQKIQNKTYQYTDLETLVKLYNESKKQTK